MTKSILQNLIWGPVSDGFVSPPQGAPSVGSEGGLDTWRWFSGRIGHLEVFFQADWTLGGRSPGGLDTWSVLRPVSPRLGRQVSDLSGRRGPKCRICAARRPPSVGFVRRGSKCRICAARRPQVSDLCGAAAPSVGFEWRRILKCRVSSVQHRPYL